MIKVSIQQVDNGFVVTVLNQGVSSFKERYEKPVYVFRDLDSVSVFLKKGFQEEPPAED